MEQARTQTAEKAKGSKNQRSLKTEVLFSWKAPARPFKRRGKEFFTTVLAVAVLLGVIFVLIEGWLPLVVIAALVFLVWVLSTIPPEEVEHKIANKGVFFADKLYRWDSLNRFWFANRFGNELLILETMTMPARLEMVINKEDKARLRQILAEYIPMEEGAATFLDKSASWIGKKLPLEN